LGEYPLNEDQTRQISHVFRFNPESSRFYYYLKPFEPLEGDSAQQIAAGR
jgi:hypothetical protein